MRYAEPPIFLKNVFDEPSRVEALLARHAPYTPLGGWYRPDVDPADPVNAMWFQNDWVHDGNVLEGADLFLDHEPYFEAARSFYDAEVIVPHSVYVNMMCVLPRSGPAHTDNPKFRGRERANTPMWLLRTMLWSGLFERWEITQATAIWWMSDVEDGGLAYWPDGPSVAPTIYAGAMANTALVGDNHRMFHQVQPVGPFDRGMPLVGARAQLKPCGGGEWHVMDGEREVYRAPLSEFRVSVLWKADVYPTAEQHERTKDDLLTLEHVADVFNDDLAARGEDARLDPGALEDPAVVAKIAVVYPEDVPVGATPSIFDPE